MVFLCLGAALPWYLITTSSWRGGGETLKLVLIRVQIICSLRKAGQLLALMGSSLRDARWWLQSRGSLSLIGACRRRDDLPERTFHTSCPSEKEDPRGESQSKKPSTTRSLLFKDKYEHRKDGAVHIKNVKWMTTFWYQCHIRYNRWFLQTTNWNTSQFLPPRVRFTKWPEALMKGTIIPIKYNKHVRHHMIHGFTGKLKKTTQKNDYWKETNRAD